MEANFKQNKLEMLQDLALAKIQLSLHKSSRTQPENRLNLIACAATELNRLTEKFGKLALFTITNAKGDILYANHEFCRLAGYTERQLIGKSHRIFNSGYHLPAFFRDLWETIGGGKTWWGTIKNRSKNGCYFWVDSLITPLLNKQERPMHYLAIRGLSKTPKIAARELEGIEVYSNGKLIVLAPGIIRLITAHRDYTEVFTGDGRSYLVLKTLKEWQEILDPTRFNRIHRSHIVNLDYIEKIFHSGKNDWMLQVADTPTPIHCSRKNGDSLKQMFHGAKTKNVGGG
jgi:PAS domain S-box-containing protein